MGDVKDLHSIEATKKIKELATDAKMCFFVTDLQQQPLSARPMSLQQVDDQGNLWFFSPAESEKNEQIENDNTVQVFFSNESSNEYLSIYGTAYITRDKQKIEELWNGFVKTWFPGGKDDPSITVIKVTPLDAYYWDTKHNKIVSLVKIATGAITGKTMDDSIQGKLTP